jgi:hypothetical protein
LCFEGVFFLLFPTKGKARPSKKRGWVELLGCFVSCPILSLLLLVGDRVRVRNRGWDRDRDVAAKNRGGGGRFLRKREGEGEGEALCYSAAGSFFQQLLIDKYLQ